MKAERWETMVEQLQPFCCSDDPEAMNPVIFADDAVTLLRRQHNRMVRLVKRIQMSPNPRSYADPIEYAAWHMEVCDKILAALQQGGKK